MREDVHGAMLCHPGYCAIEEDECKMDDETWKMLDLDADLQRSDENE